MARRVFFSFHYERDAQRASVVRNHAVTKEHEEAAGYVDKADWESIEKQGDATIKKWIAEQLKGTSVTVVLIGPETSSRRWVKYELQESYSKGNGLLGVTLHNIKDFNGKTDTAGDAYFGVLGKDKNNVDVYFASVAKTYDWVNDDGYNNFGKWVEEAATAASKR
ncbi:MAG TPA: TIR domain-containing protein [Silvibacterium sp.]|nr:TIR domain-containing protein [Silvibacterium sp.]